MNDQGKDQGDQRPMLPGSNENQGQGGRMFVSNQKEHYANPLWKVVAAVLALPLGGVFVGGIISYKSARSDVNQMVVENPTIIILKENVRVLQDNEKKRDDKFELVWNQVFAPAAPKGKR